MGRPRNGPTVDNVLAGAPDGGTAEPAAGTARAARPAGYGFLAGRAIPDGATVALGWRRLPEAYRGPARRRQQVDGRHAGSRRA